MSRGWVTVLTGPMGSGKTEELLRRVRRATIAGLDVAAYKPVLDTRTTHIESRAGGSYPCSPVGSAYDIHNEMELYDFDVVVIDEAQFFDDTLTDVVWRLSAGGADVILSGLDKDFAGRPFGPMPELLAIADDVEKLTAVCAECKGDATMTQRLINGEPASQHDPVILIGGIDDDKYEARCKGCWDVA